MPYIPRGGPAPTTGVPPEFMPQERQPAALGKNRHRSLVPVLSIRRFEYPTQKVYKQLFGKEAKYNEFGELVPVDPAA
jgi:hypothetical protein